MTTARRMLASEMSESEAIKGAKQGDSQCFEFLYGLHKKRAYSLCLRMIGNTDVAEDLTQDVFLQLYRKITTFRGDSAFDIWLHRLTVNIIFMHLRHMKHAMISQNETLEPVEERGTQKEIAVQDQILAGPIERVDLERAIESLPPGYRINFVLHDLEGYEHGEIAEMRKCSIGNTKSQLHRARNKLRDLLNVTRAEDKHKAPRRMKPYGNVIVATGRGARDEAAAV